MESLSWEKLQDFKKHEAVYLSWDPAANSSTASWSITTFRDGILYSQILPPAVLLTTLPLPSERWNAVALDWLTNFWDQNRYLPWVTLLPKLSLTRVRVLHLFESGRQRRAPRWRGQKLSLRSTLHSASATEMPSLRWSTTWASSCDKCNHGVPLSTL